MTTYNNKWISVNDQLPENGQRVLICYNYYLHYFKVQIATFEKGISLEEREKMQKAQKYLFYTMLILFTGLLIGEIATLFNSEIELSKRLILLVMIPATAMLQLAIYKIANHKEDNP